MVQGLINIKSSRLRNIIYLAAIVCGYIAFFYISSINSDKDITTCPFKKITGIPCPGCGMGRATLEIAHFNFKESIVFHPLAIPFNLVVVISVFWLIGDTFKGSNTFIKIIKTKPNNWIVWGTFILIIAVWMKNIFNGI